MRGEAYVSFVMMVALKIVWMHSLSIPWDRRIFRAYRDCPDDAIRSDTWLTIEKVSVSVTPRTFREETRSMPGSVGDVVLVRSLGLVKTISKVFLWLRQRLLLPAHSSTLLSSWTRLAMLLAGMTKSTSSANLNMWFPVLMGWRSEAATTNEPGPMLDPWIMLADMLANSDFSSARICLVRVAIEEGYDPIIDAVWHVEFGHFLSEGVMSHRVKRFTEVERDDDRHMDLSGVVHRWYAAMI